MRVLVVHNYYQRPGGEDQVFAAETALLEAHGHRVLRFTVHNDQVADMSPLALAKATVWNGAICRRLRKLLREERPQVIHFHNTFPLISPATCYVAQDEGVPVVQTLHNYRLLCPNALFYRHGHTCEDCLGKLVPWLGVVHACYRDSWAASGAVAAMLTAHRALRTWVQKVDVYIALTEFARQKFIEGGLTAEKITVKPNFIQSDPGVSENEGRYALFVGRLSPEKGVATLLKAWYHLRAIPLKIIGDGPLADEVRALVQTQKLESVEVLGWQTQEEVIALMKSARFLVFPSEWYETFGRVMIEAFACGVPVIASRLGAMAEIVQDEHTGVLFSPGNPDDLVNKVAWLWSHPIKVERMGREARADFEAKYTAEHTYHILMEIYESVIE